MNKLELPSVIGIAGVAQSGKDTFFKLSHQILEEQEQSCMRTAFADAIKADLHQILIKRAGISAYTNDPTQKKLIRPMLVAYGTELIRTLDPDFWINRAKMSIELSRHMDVPVFITDVRYENEIDWIQNEEGGVVVHVHKVGNRPANKEERESDPILKAKANVCLSWKHVGEGEEDSLKGKVSYALKKIHEIHSENTLCKAN